MGTKRKSGLATKIEKPNPMFTTSDINSFIFLALSSDRGWTRPDPTLSFMLCMKVAPKLPNMSLFGLSALEQQGVSQVFRCVLTPSVVVKSWNTSMHYRKERNSRCVFSITARETQPIKEVQNGTNQSAF